MSMTLPMSCNQCEQTMGGTGCHHSPGICGKDADVQSLQETILYGLKGMAAYANHARRPGKHDESVSAFSSAFKRRFGSPPVSVRLNAVGAASLAQR